MRQGRRAIRRAALALATLGGLGGCMVGPDYEQPAAQLAPTWLETPSPTTFTIESTDAAEWWRTFEDPVLDRLVQLAYQQNLNLGEAGLRVLQARAQLGVSIGEFYPQQQNLNGNALFNRISERSVNGLSSPLGSRNGFWTTEAFGQVAWELDFWGRFRRNIEASQNDFLSAISNYDAVLVTLIADVADAYVTLRTLEQRLLITQENVVVQRQSLAIAEARFAGGVTSERDVQQAKSILFSTEALIPDFEAQIRQSKNAISTLIGMPPSPLDDIITGPSKIPTAPPQVAIGIPTDLLRRRPDIRAAEYAAARESALIGVEKADLYPAFSLTGQFGFASTNLQKASLSDIARWQSRFAAAGPTVQWNILNYGQITNRVRAQDASFQASISSYQNLVLQAQQEVENGIARFLGSQARAESLVGSVGATRRSAALAQLQYQEGIADFTTVLVAEQDLLQREDELATAMGAIPSSLVQIFRALGGGWQIRDAEFVSPQIRAVMAKRTDWGDLLSPRALQPPTPAERRRLVSAPDW